MVYCILLIIHDINLIEYQNTDHERMSTHHGCQIEQKLASITCIKRMISAKALTLSAELSNKIECHEKFLKFLKKQIKDQKLNDVQVWQLGQSFMDETDQLFRNCYWEYRLSKTDFDCYLTRLKYCEESNKKSKAKLDQLTNSHLKKQSQILLNCKENVLMELRNQVQNFDIKTLIDKSTQILLSLPFATNFTQIQTNCVKQIVQQICRNYHIVPYHNFTHGFGVLMSLFNLTQMQTINALFDDCTLFFCLIACLAHDIRHQGVNTLFQVKTNSNLSILYGKSSVMQKMHLATTLQILTRKQTTSTLFNSLSTQNQVKARKIIAKSILATGMAKHYDYVSIISEGKLNLDSTEGKQVMIEALVHGCDIQNPSLDFQSYIYWAHLICMEFHDQTIKQKEYNVEITDFLKFNSLTYFFKNQSNFANTIVLPLWQSIENFMPETQSKEYVKRIKKNISVLSEALRRNSEPVLIHKSFQQYLSSQLQN